MACMKRAEATKGESVMKGLKYSARCTAQATVVSYITTNHVNMVNVQRVNYNIHADFAEQWNSN